LRRLSGACARNDPDLEPQQADRRLSGPARCVRRRPGVAVARERPRSGRVGGAGSHAVAPIQDDAARSLRARAAVVARSLDATSPAPLPVENPAPVKVFTAVSSDQYLHGALLPQRGTSLHARLRFPLTEIKLGAHPA